MSELQYGKKITSESYFDGKPTNKQFAYSIPVIVKDKSQVLSELIKAIDLITDKKTHTIKITIHANKEFQLKMMTKEYMIEVESKFDAS